FFLFTRSETTNLRLRLNIMDKIFNNIPLPERNPQSEYYCGGGCSMLLFENAEKAELVKECEKLKNAGFELYQKNGIHSNLFFTFRKDITVHLSFFSALKQFRIIADPCISEYQREEIQVKHTSPTVLWQFEVDHSLIDCGMCYIIRCRDGSFFVIDSAHFYSINDDIRIINFLKKQSGEKKPRVAGWYFSHCHEDHVDKFLDILRFHRDEISIDTLYYNFPSMECKGSECWDYASKIKLKLFEDEIKKHPDIKSVRLHAGQVFFVKNIKITVLCTHEDVYPASFEDFNNTSTAIVAETENTRILFPGDCSVESDKVLCKAYENDLKCDIVQVSHHGHTGCSSEFYEYAGAKCALFPVTSIKFDEDYPRHKANRRAIELAREWYVASNGTVEIPLPYGSKKTTVYPDETKEDWNGIYQLWCYEYTDEIKENSFWNKNRHFSVTKKEQRLSK
nr:hypothetical protein [Clostridiales bacterium]